MKFLSVLILTSAVALQYPLTRWFLHGCDIKMMRAHAMIQALA